MDLHAGAVLGDEAVPDGRMGTEDGGDSRGPLWGYQNGISSGQKDGRNRGVFLYSDRRSATGMGQQKYASQVGKGQ